MNPRRIIVPEYDTIRIVPSLGAEEKIIPKSISKQEAESIRAFQRGSGRTFFNIGPHRLTTTNWVGSFSIGDLCIDVIPKIYTEKTEQTKKQLAMKNMLHMVSAGGLVKFRPADISWLAKSDTPLITAFLQLYIDNLRKEWFKGPVRRYVTDEANRFFLKGKIIFSRHLKENSFHKERFYTASDEFTVDNPVSRLLKAALNVCRNFPLGPHASTQAKTLLCLFDEVSDERDATKCLSEITIDRTTFRFQYLINLAKSIIERVSPWKQSLKAPVYSLMFDMNEVFEKFIAAELKRAVVDTNCMIKSQSAEKCLARRYDPKRPPLGKNVFRLRPDVSVLNSGILQCLIDTKWKKLKSSKNKEPNPKYFRTPENSEPVSQADMYQMFAYAHKYRCSVILIYPQEHDPQAQLPARHLLEYHCDDTQEPYIIMVCTVDITIDLDRATERERLRTSLVGLIQILDKPIQEPMKAASKERRNSTCVETR